MADKNIGKITQVIGAVLDLKFSEGYYAQGRRKTCGRSCTASG